MDLLTLILMCSVSGAPAIQEMAYQLAASIEAHPWHIEDLTDHVIYDPSSFEEAVQMADALLEAGHTLRVGIGLVDVRQARSMGFTTAELFRPCRSIGIATDGLEAVFKSTERRAKHAALVSYFKTTSSSSESSAWALTVVAIEVPTLEALHSPETSVPHFRVHAPEARHSLTWSTSTSPSAVSPPSDESSASSRDASASPTSASPRSRPRRPPTKRRFSPQADVTTERLPTSDELKESASKESSE